MRRRWQTFEGDTSLASGSAWKKKRKAVRSTAAGSDIFLIDMEKFIEERLNYIDIRKGRASQKKEDADEEEIKAARAACGALNWLIKEGRPDAAGPSSLMASRLSLSSLKVEDLYHINDAIKQLKEQSKLAIIQIQPLRNMRLSVVGRFLCEQWISFTRWASPMKLN